MAEILKQWAPVVIGLLASAGVLKAAFAWARAKIEETRLVRSEMVEGMLDRILLAAVCYVEKKTVKLAAEGASKMSGNGKRIWAADLAKKLIAARGLEVPDESELGDRVEEAWARVDDADFAASPARAAAAGSSISGSDSTPADR